MAKNIDPSRTALLRRQAVAEMNRRMGWLAKEVFDLIARQDVFGLKPDTGILQLQAPAASWKFLSDSQKTGEFREWLQERFDAGILGGSNSETAWMNEYIDSSYKKGVIRGYNQVRSDSAFKDTMPVLSEEGMVGAQQEFLNLSLAGSETTKNLEQLYSRTFTDLKGVGDSVSKDLSHILTQGLADGAGPHTIARQMTKKIGMLNRTRARTIARTEIIAAQARGQLQSYKDLGVETVGVMVEWLTAGDDRVCPLCDDMHGVVLPIENADNLIPRHPNCRCAWLPVSPRAPKEAQQKYGEDAEKAIADSLKSEAGKNTKKRTMQQTVDRSTWKGKSLWKKDLPAPKPAGVPKAVKPKKAVTKPSKPADPFAGITNDQLGAEWAKLRNIEPGLLSEQGLKRIEAIKEEFAKRRTAQARLKEVSAPKTKVPKKPVPAKKPKLTKDEWYGSLSSNQVEAIEDWTGGAYDDIIKTQLGVIEEREKNLEYIRHLNSAMKTSPKHKGTVYRGINLTEEKWDEMKTGLRKGKMEFKTFSSTSTDEETALFFSGGDKQIRVMMEIKATGKSGVDISALAEDPGELEVLFSKGSRFNVKKIAWDAGSKAQRISLEEIAPG